MGWARAGCAPWPTRGPASAVWRFAAERRHRRDRRRGRSRVRLRKRRNDLPELILAEGAERLRRDVAERGCREREPDVDIVTRCLGDEDEVVTDERYIHAILRFSCFQCRFVEFVMP